MSIKQGMHQGEFYSVADSNIYPFKQDSGKKAIPIPYDTAPLHTVTPSSLWGRLQKNIGTGKHSALGLLFSRIRIVHYLRNKLK